MYLKKSKSGSLKAQRTFYDQRLSIFFCGFVLLFAGLIVRLFHLYFFPPASENLKKVASNQYHKSIKLSPYRGTIYDRKGIPLAISIRSPSVAINPRAFHPTSDQISDISRLLRIKVSSLEGLSKREAYFSWVKRKVGTNLEKHLADLKIPGLHILTEPARFYPSSGSASHIIGQVNIDDKGQSGIESLMDRHLRGENLSLQLSTDARGKLIFLHSSSAKPEESGHDVHLTIDLAIQEIVDEALERGVKNAKAHSGFAMVADPHSGQILAIANFQNQESDKESAPSLRNKAILDLFEPGSIIKPLVISQAIDQNLVTTEDLIDCENGRLAIPGGAIHDDHPAKVISVAETIVHSSNICSYKIASLLGKEGLNLALRHFGIGSKDLTLGFQSEHTGRIPNWQGWQEMRFANIAFGQGLVVKGLEMLQAYSSIANGGYLFQPYIVNKVVSGTGAIVKAFEPKHTNRVLQASTARQMREILHRVTLEGTGTQAKTQFYTVAGKTGTAQKVDPILKIYSPDKRIANFIGFSPAFDPHIAVFVVIDEPQRKPYYGGLWAAPVFREIAEKTLRYLNVAPDIPNGRFQKEVRS